MITDEVAFIVIAVTDKERSRKFYQETLELKPATTAMEGAWVEYELGATTIGARIGPFVPGVHATGISTMSIGRGSIISALLVVKFQPRPKTNGSR